MTLCIDKGPIRESHGAAERGHGFEMGAFKFREKAAVGPGEFRYRGRQKLSGAGNAGAGHRGIRHGLESVRHLGMGAGTAAPGRKPNGRLPESGATDCPANSPGNRPATPNSRETPRPGIPSPKSPPASWVFSAKFGRGGRHPLPSVLSLWVTTHGSYVCPGEPNGRAITSGCECSYPLARRANFEV